MFVAILTLSEKDVNIVTLLAIQRNPNTFFNPFIRVSMTNTINTYFEFQNACKQYMADHNCPIDQQIIVDHKLHRFSRDEDKTKKDEWYIAFQDVTASGDYWVCIFGSWSDNATHTYKSWSRETCSAEENILRKELLDVARQANDQQRREKHECVAIEAKDIWLSCSYDPTAEQMAYYLRKGIKPLGVAYMQYRGMPAMVIPVRNITGSLRSLQFIYLDHDDKFGKRFLGGGEVSNNFFNFGHLDHLTNKIYITEGYATGASIHEATGAEVVVAFDCHNLKAVTRLIKDHHPHAEIIIAGDDDRNNPKNPGRTSAEAIASELKIQSIFPQFPDTPEAQGLKDFNDLHQLQGLPMVKAQLTPTETVKKKEPIFKSLTIQEAMMRPKKKWYVNKIFGPGDKVMIYGPAASGKTFIAIDLVMKLCLGEIFANKFIVQKPLTVAYCIGEGHSGIFSRFSAAMFNRGKIEMPNLFLFEEIPQLNVDYKTELTAANFVKDWKDKNIGSLDALILDTFSTACVGSNENETDEMRKAIAVADYIQKQLGCVVIFIHHTKKDGTSERGNTVIRASMDCMIETKALGSNKYKMFCSKLKDDEQWSHMNFSLKKCFDTDSATVQWEEIPDDESIGFLTEPMKKILVHLEETPGVKYTAKQCGIWAQLTSKSAIYDILNKMEENGYVKNELRNPELPQSSQNPMVYFVEKKES